MLLQHGRRSSQRHLAPRLPRQPLNPQRPHVSTNRSGQAPQLLHSTHAPHPTASPSTSTQHLNAATAGGRSNTTSAGPATPTTTPGHTPAPTPGYTPTTTPLPSRAPSLRWSAAYRASAPSSRTTSFKRTPSGVGLTSSSAPGEQASNLMPAAPAPMTGAAILSLPPQQQQPSQAMEAAAHALAEVEARLPLAPPQPQPHSASHPHPPHVVRLLSYASFSPFTASPPPADLPATAARSPLAAPARSPLGAAASLASRRSEPGVRATLSRPSSSSHSGALGVGAGHAAAATTPGAAGAGAALQPRLPLAESEAPAEGTTARAVARSVFGARRASTPASLGRGASGVGAQEELGQDAVASPLPAQQPAGMPGAGGKVRTGQWCAGPVDWHVVMGTCMLLSFSDTTHIHGLFSPECMRLYGADPLPRSSWN